jgi:alkanesulfonate monooxygenase SsuD/methylene tetrahydromethanopterin reductase-like flavin-dependent oxidoreductase (luciferase family)
VDLNLKARRLARHAERALRDPREPRSSVLCTFVSREAPGEASRQTFLTDIEADAELLDRRSVSGDA